MKVFVLVKEPKHTPLPNHSNPRTTEMENGLLNCRDMIFKLFTNLGRKMSWLMLFQGKVRIPLSYCLQCRPQSRSLFKNSKLFLPPQKARKWSTLAQAVNNIQACSPPDTIYFFFCHQIFVPASTDFRQHIMTEFHASPYDDHSSIKPTLKRIAASFYWPKWTKDVHRFVQQCSTCQKNKYMPTKTQGLLQPLPIPKQV